LTPVTGSRIRGSLLGGAVGDALSGVTGETQLALFTAEGLVLAARDPTLTGRSGSLRSVHRAHLRWLKTQGEHSAHPTFERTSEGWLLARAELQDRRAPRSGSLAALRGPRMGRVEQPLNSSRDCGGLMRAVAVGLASGVGDPFGAAREIAALTHGHPTVQLAAGFLALAIREACSGTPLRAACDEALEELGRQPAHQECRGALDRALALAERGGFCPDDLSSLSSGRAAHEALALALLCALAAPDFETALRLAIGGDGKSSTAAAVAGSLLGAAGGEDVIPRRWLARLELRDAIERTAEELGTLV
jgi:ADP-ribosyl-[dinitrogen reductase] hydrolase